jgi:hypothetical protein
MDSQDESEDDNDNRGITSIITVLSLEVLLQQLAY